MQLPCWVVEQTQSDSIGECAAASFDHWSALSKHALAAHKTFADLVAFR